MEQDEDTSSPMSPFWVPKKNNHRLRRSYSLLLTSTSLIVLLLAFALVFVLIVVPTLRSFTSTIFNPQTLKLKHSWDSLNLILVLFAVVCGFLTKNDTNETQTPRFDNSNSNSNSNSNYYSYHHQRSFSNPVTPPSWYENSNSNSNRSFNRLSLRTVGSYPDLRQQPPWNTDDERCRFYDDTHPLLRHQYSRLEPEDEVVVENSRTVTCGDVSDSPVRRPEMKPLSEAVRRNAERAYEPETIEKPEINDFAAEISTSRPRKPPHSVRKKKGEIATNENTETIISSAFSVTPVVQPDPEPQPPQKPPHSVRKKKREITSKENTETIISSEFSVTPVVQPDPEPQPLPPARTKPVRRNAKRTYQVETIEKPENSDYFGESSQPPSPLPLPAVIKSDLHGKKERGSATKEFLITLRRKKKKQRQRSVENFESLLNSQLAKQSQPPSPPPPASVFHNLLSFNKSKNKTHYLVPVETYHPRLPNKTEQTYKEKVVMTGNESPLIPIPPPPPPPPFKLPDWRFRVQGDYVRVDSIGSSRSGSPDSDGVVESETSQCNSPLAPSGEGSGSGNGNAASLFCPSPDVDTKAHNFIENFRAGLRMAKMNSIKEKQGIGRSNLGPLPKP